MRNKLYILIILFVLPLFAYTQIADFSYMERFSSDSLLKDRFTTDIYPTWNENGSTFYYSFTGENGLHYYLVNPAKKEKKRMFDSDVLLKKLSTYTSKEYDAKSKRINIKRGSLKKNTFVISENNREFSYNMNTTKLEEVTKKEAPVKVYTENKYPWRRYSQDSTYYVFGYDHNLYLQKASEDEDTATQLTTDGEEFYSFITNQIYLPAVVKEKKKTMPSSAYWVSGSEKIIVLRDDKRAVAEMSVINNLQEPRPTLTTYKFPMPGDENVPQYELYLFDTKTSKKTKIDINKYPDQKFEYVDVPYRNDSRYVYFYRKSRIGDKIDLCRLDAKTGEFKELFSENTSPHLNVPLFNSHILENGKNIIWWSERTGFGQYYLYDFEGNLKNAITKKDFVAGVIHSIDTLAESFIYEAYGENKNIDPYYRMYYKVNFDGSQNTLLTPGDGYHNISISPDKKHLLDTYSRMDMLPVNIVRDMHGNAILDLEQAATTMFDTSFQFPERVKLKSTDGVTDLYGVLYKPFNMDSTKKYPVISNVYPGPIDDLVPKRFTIDDNYNQTLAQLGFIVIQMEYRGASPYRGRDFHNYGYGNLRDYALADDKHAIIQLAKNRSYMDLDRVGIYGHSGGGFMAATALLSDPDFYKVAVAASGNYDNRIYTQYWGETYHGVRIDTVQNNETTKYKFSVDIPTTISMAGNLRGKLFLITGDVDINVHPAQTLRMANALIKENKRFDMMVLPGKDHGLGDKYFINLIRYYFVENLLGQKQTHINIVTHK